MTIEDFIRLILRNIVLLILITVLGGAAGFGLSYTRPTVYAAEALGYVSAGNATDADGNPVIRGGSMDVQYGKAQSYLPLVNTRIVGQRVVDSLGLDADPDAVAADLQATLDPNAPIMTITARASTPQAASDIANAAVEATAAEAAALEGEPAVTQLVPYQTALQPSAPESPDRLRYAVAGAALGLLLALGLAVIRDRNDSRIRTTDDVTRAVQAPVLGVLPDDKELQRAKNGTLPEPKTFQVREALRKLRTNLRFISVDEPPRSIVVTSSAPAEGKSTVSANLARVMARAGQRTVLIDADLRRPQIANQFGLDGDVGLTQLLAGTVELSDVIHRVGTSQLWVLPAGQIPPNPSELLGSQRMRQLIAELSADHLVMIDAPPVLAVTDAQLLTRHADGAIVVTVAGQTRRAALARAVDSLTAVDGRVHGVVLNRASKNRFTRLVYGDAEYGYAAYGSKYGYAGNAAYGDLVEVDENAPEVLPEPAAPVAAPAPVGGAAQSGHVAPVRAAHHAAPVAPPSQPTSARSASGRSAPSPTPSSGRTSTWPGAEQNARRRARRAADLEDGSTP